MLFQKLTGSHHDCCSAHSIYELKQLTPGDVEVLLMALDKFTDGSVEGRKAAALYGEIARGLE